MTSIMRYLNDNNNDGVFQPDSEMSIDLGTVTTDFDTVCSAFRSCKKMTDSKSRIMTPLRVPERRRSSLSSSTHSRSSVVSCCEDPYLDESTHSESHFDMFNDSGFQNSADNLLNWAESFSRELAFDDSIITEYKQNINVPDIVRKGRRRQSKAKEAQSGEDEDRTTRKISSKSSTRSGEDKKRTSRSSKGEKSRRTSSSLRDKDFSHDTELSHSPESSKRTSKTAAPSSPSSRRPGSRSVKLHRPVDTHASTRTSTSSTGSTEELASDSKKRSTKHCSSRSKSSDSKDDLSSSCSSPRKSHSLHKSPGSKDLKNELTSTSSSLRKSHSLHKSSSSSKDLKDSTLTPRKSHSLHHRRINTSTFGSYVFGQEPETPLRQSGSFSSSSDTKTVSFFEPSTPLTSSIEKSRKSKSLSMLSTPVSTKKSSVFSKRSSSDHGKSSSTTKATTSSVSALSSSFVVQKKASSPKQEDEDSKYSSPVSKCRSAATTNALTERIHALSSTKSPFPKTAAATALAERIQALSAKSPYTTKSSSCSSVSSASLLATPTSKSRRVNMIMCPKSPGLRPPSSKRELTTTPTTTTRSRRVKASITSAVKALPINPPSPSSRSPTTKPIKQLRLSKLLVSEAHKIDEV